MIKLLFIAILIGTLLYFVGRRLFNFGRKPGNSLPPRGYIHLSVDNRVTNQVIQSSILTVCTGFILFLLILFLGMKVHILLILLPVSLYLMGQLFLVANHLASTRKVAIWYNPMTKGMRLQTKDGRIFDLNLYTDIDKVVKINAVQRNRKVLLGVYELTGSRMQFRISNLLTDNPKNEPFFQDVEQHFDPKVSTHLFPTV